MAAEIEATLIGYSVFDTSQECYEYNENACYIAANQKAAKRFLNTSFFPEDCEIHSVSWDDLLKDYGCSGGEYAMEPEVFDRFKSLAQQHGVTFEAEPFDGDISIMVVEIDHQFLIRVDDEGVFPNRPTAFLPALRRAHSQLPLIRVANLQHVELACATHRQLSIILPKVGLF